MAATSPPEPYVLITGQHGANPWKAEFLHTAAFVDKMGASLLAAFAKCFYVMDRLRALTELAALSKMHHKSTPEGDDTPAHMRNYWLIGHLIAAELYELAKAIQGLGGAKVMQVLKDPAPWVALNDLRGRWHSDPTAETIRNQTAHHHGDRDVYEQGLARVVDQFPDRVNFYESADNMHRSGFVTFTMECLVLGLQIEDEDYAKMMGRMRQDIALLPDLLLDLFYAVLKEKGIVVIDQRTPPLGGK